MSSSLGTFFLVAACLCGVFSFISYGLSLKLKSKILIRNAKYFYISCIFVVFAAFVTLEISLFKRDYSLQYVYEHTANSTNKLFTFTAAWAGLEGSLLLWTIILCGYGSYVIFSSRKTLKDFDATTVIANMVMLFFIVYFLLMMLVSASPFENASLDATNGLGANPLLQEHYAMAIHPPLLYIGYVGFVVPLAYLVGSLFTKDFSSLSDTRVRRTSMIAWMFLTAGIILGAWWSYEVLGWGGYWAWDPVENASLLPWLTATAYLHSAIVQTKSQMLRGWNATMVIATCSLTILGTFLTRSGIVNSVHAFTQSHVGSWLLALFGIVSIGGAALLVWRFDDIKSKKTLKGATKKETMFLLNNVIFCVFALVVLLGTTYPMIADSLRGETLSVGTPYYQRFAIPFGFSILLLMGIAPMVTFRETNTSINERIRIPAIAGVFMVGVGVVLQQKAMTALAIGACTFVVVGSFMILYKTFKQSGKRTIIERPRKVGAMIVHIGIAFIGLSIVLSSHTSAYEVTVTKNQMARLGSYQVTYVSDKTTSSQDIVSTTVTFKVFQNGKSLGTLSPTVKTYPSRNMSVGMPSVHTSFLRDTYLTLSSSPSGNKITIKIAQNPAVVYIWISGIIIILGSIICLIPQKRKNESINSNVKDAKELVN